jgi:hypothetical protein
LASRFESGSSNRKTFGLRTIARPMATRWRWPAGELARLALEQILDVEDARRLLHRARSRPWDSLQPQPERHVLVDRHVRVERVVLEHHRHVAVLRRHVVDDLAVDRDLAVGDLLEPCDHAQRRRLAAARRADSTTNSLSSYRRS